jgi:CheY-like chemotaxis protein
MQRRFEEMPFLIAEDSDDDLLLLQRVLRRVGVPNPQVATATGEKTIQYLEETMDRENERPFPVILFLDLLMPGAGGLAVLEWLRTHSHPPVTVVLHTGVEDETLLQRARDLGANFFLPKGARSDAIQEVFRRARAEWDQHEMLEHASAAPQPVGG